MTERPLPPSWDGSVVLDIGGDIGALVLRCSSDLNGAELDLHPDDATQPNTHSAVRERRLPSGSSYAAVYPALRAGTYSIVGTAQRVSIEGGRVTEVDLDTSAHDPADHHHPHGDHAHAHSHSVDHRFPPDRVGGPTRPLGVR
jgi:hypothetical protein